MSFNNGNERRKLNAKWEHLRVQYREAGMSEDAIQAMYEFDLGVLNSERAYITNTMTVSDDADDCAAKETSDFKQYEKAVTVTDTYHETKSRFAWIGEIENEQLLTALETLKVEDLEIITMYAYEGYDITEISKVYGVSRPTINLLNQAWPNAVFGLRPRLFFLLIPYIHIFVLHRRFYERKRPYHLRASDLRGNGTDPGNDPLHPHTLRCLPLQFCRIQGVQNRHCSQRRP